MFPELESSRTRRTVTATQRVLRALHLDGPLQAGIGLLAGMGLFVLYSAVGENVGLWTKQAIRLAIAVVAMVALAQVPPRWLYLLIHNNKKGTCSVPFKKTKSIILLFLRRSLLRAQP